MIIKSIKNELIKSVHKGESKIFLPILLMSCVETDMPNKIRFYCFYKKSLDCFLKNLKGDISYKEKLIERDISHSYSLLEFFDSYYTNAQLTIEMTEYDSKIVLSTLPF